jgi:ankyrin repeat protein
VRELPDRPSAARWICTRQESGKDLFAQPLAIDPSCAFACLSSREPSEKTAPTPSQRPEQDGYTCLHYAALMGHAQVAKILVEKVGDVLTMVGNEYGDTALHVAAISGSQGVVRELAVAGGRKLMEARNEEGKTARDAAEQHRKSDAVLMLDQLHVDMA